ncbi:Cdc6/Cdc18 family protein [Halococcus qingdaonensis]|uniref:Cdc6/Cdc18 family protein n=1 Tax=Halococcus qingdaonensis TaxID=224402 RepID=UPI002116282E|nr:AAA family ATPase [Halococcus qingdaonensis]
MTDYDDLFDDTAPDDSVFTDKGALDPLGDPEEIVAREDQQRELATLLNGVHEGYLPTTVSIYGPPGTGKTLVTRRLCEAFAARTDVMAVEYVNLKECRSLFSAANEIHFELTGEKKGAYEGLDGVFEGIWAALADYPEWTVLLLDEIDQLRHDTNYDPSEFFYRLLRGEGKRTHDVQLSAWLLSNELLEVDLRLDSRVESAMGGEEVFFPPYGRTELEALLEPRVERAFREGALPESVFSEGVRVAANRWGDARKALRLFRQTGETATERGLEQVSMACLEANYETTERDAVLERLSTLPRNHFLVLVAITGYRQGGTIVQPVTTDQIESYFATEQVPEALQLGTRAIREVVTDLETMGLVETWIESRGQGGRVKQLATSFEPEWVRAAYHEQRAGTPTAVTTASSDGTES